MKNYTKQAIERAKIAGYDPIGKFHPDIRNYSCPLDPEFWHFLGIALGNKEEMRCKNPDGSNTPNPNCDNPQCEYAGYKDPRRMFDNFMDSVWNGKDTESFFKQLLENKQ